MPFGMAGSGRVEPKNDRRAGQPRYDLVVTAACSRSLGGRQWTSMTQGSGTEWASSHSPIVDYEITQKDVL